MTIATAECPIQTSIETPPPASPPPSALRCIVAHAALLRALTICAAVTPARSPKPILQCVKMTAAQGRLTLCTTDLETGICLTIPAIQAAVERDGEVAVPVKDLCTIVRHSADATLTLDVQDDYLYIRGVDARFKLLMEKVDQFPFLPQFAAPADFEVGSDTLGRMIGQTLFACTRAVSRFAQNSVRVERHGDALSLVATDGLRLAIATADCQTAGADTQAAMIPMKTMAVLAKLLGKPTARRQNVPPLPVQVQIGEHEALFVVGDVTVITTLSEGTFPTYQDVVPARGSIQATLATAELIAGLERAKVWVGRYQPDAVRLSFAADQLTISPFDKSLDGAALHVPVADYQGEPLEIAFKPRFLLDALAVVGTEQATLDMRAANKAATLRTGTFLYVVMPVPL